ncbi:MAG: hypothetical protein ACLR53_10055 [Evtepia gabavorous]
MTEVTAGFPRGSPLFGGLGRFVPALSKWTGAAGARAGACGVLPAPLERQELGLPAGPHFSGEMGESTRGCA